MNRLRQFAFPLSLAVILGSLSAWLGQASQISIEEIPLNPKEPQYLIAQAAAKRYDSTGSLQQQLVSPKAWQLPDQKNVYFEQPDLRIWTQERAEYHVTAQQARYELAYRGHRAQNRRNARCRPLPIRQQPRQRARHDLRLSKRATEPACTSESPDLCKIFIKPYFWPPS